MPTTATSRPAEAAGAAGNPFLFGALAPEMWRPAFAWSAEANEKFHRAFVALSYEWQGFLGRRAKEDMSLLQRISSSSSPEGVWAAYVAFFQKAAEEYAQEFARLSTLLVRLQSPNAVAEPQLPENPAASPPLDKAA